jgi:hypothetical protein
VHARKHGQASQHTWSVSIHQFEDVFFLSMHASKEVST